MAHQNRFQVFTQNTRLVYLSQEALDEFRTKKLLGMKIISVEANPTHLVDHILDLKAEGVTYVEMIQNMQNPYPNQCFRFKLK